MKVMICSEVNLCSEGIWSMLEKEADIQVLGSASSEKEIGNLLQYSPDVIITDFECCKKVLSATPLEQDKKVLLVNVADPLSSDNIKNLIANGLGGILSADADSRQLLKAIHKLSEGELWLDRHTVSSVLSYKESKKRDLNLTKKEMEILNYVCEGMTNKEIAKKLFISEQTVKSHCNHLFKKFGVRSRLKLAVSAPKYFPGSMTGLQ